MSVRTISRTCAALTTVLAVTAARATQAQMCPRLPAGLTCAPVPTDESGRRQLLQALDLDGREAVSRGDYAIAASAFGCLVEADPRSESAGNLSVVLREQGALGDALLMARCAEELAPPGPARERARVRRLDIEQRLGLAPSVAAPPAAASAVDLESDRHVTATPLAAPARAHRSQAYAVLVAGAALLVGAGVLYAVAHQRANQFGDEQQANGYSDRARQLHDDARNWEIGSWAAGSAAVAAILTGGALLRF
ncbi:MAG TPA: hypothetical protein VGL59_07675 [Polyangia bacterium]|jgi:hypothetical protein